MSSLPEEAASILDGVERKFEETRKRAESLPDAQREAIHQAINDARTQLLATLGAGVDTALSHVRRMEDAQRAEAQEAVPEGIDPEYWEKARNIVEYSFAAQHHRTDPLRIRHRAIIVAYLLDATKPPCLTVKHLGEQLPQISDVRSIVHSLVRKSGKYRDEPRILQDAEGNRYQVYKEEDGWRLFRVEEEDEY